MTVPVPPPAASVEVLLQQSFEALTRAERLLASHVLRAYPVAALGSITALAKAAGVSTPTVVRLVQKLGFRGYPEFQAALRGEVEEMLVSPLAKHDRWSKAAPQTHILNRFADATLANLSATLQQIDHAEFDAVCGLLADPARAVFAMGGRITHAMADHFVTHMKVVRQGMVLMSDASSAWAPALLDMKPGDVLLVFDIRRYENTVLQMVEMAVERGAVVVLVTDQWVSPAAAQARHRLSCQIEVPSAWDSSVTILFLVEALVAGVEALTWDATQARLKVLEELNAKTRFFRHFR